MKILYIYHNLGLGDHIISNGLVRCYAEKYDKVFVFCKLHNVNSVEYMYRDDKSIEILPAADKAALGFINRNPQHNYLVARSSGGLNKSFDVELYDVAKITSANKWNRFYFERDSKREQAVYKKFGLKKDDRFVFVHEDNARGFRITNHLPDIRIIRPDSAMKRESNIFDYLYMIEKAEEVHCIDSAFLNLIDCIQLRNKGLFFHKYVRDSSKGKTPSLKMNWRVYE